MFTNKIQLVRVVKLNLVLFTKVGEKDIQAVVIMNLRINPTGRLLNVVKSCGKSLVAISMGNMKLQMILISLLIVIEHLGSVMALIIFQPPSIPMIVLIYTHGLTQR